MAKNAWSAATEKPVGAVGKAENPTILPETHFAAARLFESQGQLSKAIHQYRQAVAVNHHFPEASHRLGLLLSRTGEREEAVKALQRAVELRPKDPVMRNDLGFELSLCRRWADAERELSKALELRPAFARASVNLGMVQSRLGRFDEALASFRAVLPEPDAYYNLGLMYRGQRRYGEAVAAFRHVLSMNPGFAAAQRQLEQVIAQYQPSLPPEEKSAVASAPPMEPGRRPTSAPGPVPLPAADAVWEPDQAPIRSSHAIDVVARQLIVLDDPGDSPPKNAIGTTASATDERQVALASFAATLTESPEPMAMEADPVSIAPAPPSYSVAENAMDADVRPNSAEPDPTNARIEADASAVGASRFAVACQVTSPDTKSGDPRDFLRALEDQLSIVRNEIRCLESLEGDAPSSAAPPSNPANLGTFAWRLRLTLDPQEPVKAATNQTAHPQASTAPLNEDAAGTTTHAPAPRADQESENETPEVPGDGHSSGAD